MIEREDRDTSEFRNYWLYMPQFRVLDQNDFVTTMAVFLVLFIFIALICFAAVIVIAFTRCMTIALTNARVYDDLRAPGGAEPLSVPVRKGAGIQGVSCARHRGHGSHLRLLPHDYVLQ